MSIPIPVAPNILELIVLARENGVGGNVNRLPIQDLALLLLMECPEALEPLLEKLHHNELGRYLKRMDSFFVRDGAVRPMAMLDEFLLARLSGELRQSPLISDLSDFANVYLLPNPDMCSFLIHHFQTPLPEHSGPLPHEEFDFFHYDPRMGEAYLDVKEPKFEWEYMKLFGSCLFDDSHYFDPTPAEKYSLRPLKEGLLDFAETGWPNGEVANVRLLELGYVESGKTRLLPIPDPSFTNAAPNFTTSVPNTGKPTTR